MLLLTYLVGSWLWSYTATLKIALIPVSSVSHIKSVAVLGQELARRGHQINIVQSSYKKTWENITSAEAQKFSFKYNEMYRTSEFLDHVVQDCIDLFNNKEVMRILRKTDLIIGEIFVFCPLYLARYLKKPIIGIHHVPMKYLDGVLGNSPTQHILSTSVKKMTLLQRISQYFLAYIVAPIASFRMMKKFDVIRKQLDIEDTPTEIIQKCQLIIVPYDPVIEYPHALPPNMFAPGIWTNEPAKQLPTHVEDFISTAKNGFILVSFGTVFSASNYGADSFQSLVDTLGKLDINVILKGTPNILKRDIPANILLLEDVPQNDVLGHPSIKLFVTHAGILSVRESCYHGVPVLVVPRGFDQKDNGHVLTQRLKMGKMIEFDPFNFDTWLTLIPEIIKNFDYKRNALRCSQIMRSRHHTYARILAADMVEKFIVWNFNASHLQPAISNMPFYEYYLLDMYSAFLLSILTAFLLAKMFLK